MRARHSVRHHGAGARVRAFPEQAGNGVERHAAEPACCLRAHKPHKMMPVLVSAILCLWTASRVRLRQHTHLRGAWQGSSPTAPTASAGTNMPVEAPTPLVHIISRKLKENRANRPRKSNWKEGRSSGRGSPKWMTSRRAWLSGVKKSCIRQGLSGSIERMQSSCTRSGLSGSPQH